MVQAAHLWVAPAAGQSDWAAVAEASQRPRLQHPQLPRVDYAVCLPVYTERPQSPACVHVHVKRIITRRRECLAHHRSSSHLSTNIHNIATEYLHAGMQLPRGLLAELLVERVVREHTELDRVHQLVLLGTREI